MDIAEIRRKAKQLREKMEEPVEGPQELPVTVEEIEEALQEPESHPLTESGESGYKAEEEKIEVAGQAQEAPEVGWAVPTSQELEIPVEGKEEGLEETADDEVEAITFMLDKEEYAVDIHQVKEVIKTRELTEIPRAPRDISGIISLRGTVVPIMNLRGRIGMPPRDSGKRIIIVKDGAGLLGLIVDDVKHVIRVSQKNIEPPPAINTIDGEFIRGIGRYKGGMFILLEMEKILEKM